MLHGRRICSLVATLAGSALWVAAALADETAPSPTTPVAVHRQGSWWIAVSENFHVCSLASVQEAESTARHCERLRGQLTTLLGFTCGPTAWRPKCQVILYPTLRSYVAAVGPGSDVTLGSSLVEPQRGRIVVRRIDLRTDVDDFRESALPHELCHLIVADHYREGPAPLWYDEGLALLVDPAEKLARHAQDFRDGLRRGTSFTVNEVLAAATYPSPERMGVFYGQCASLTHFLWRQGAPAKLHEFIAESRAVGVNLAVRSVYGLNGGVAELQRRWLHDGATDSGRQLVGSLLASRSGSANVLLTVER